MKIVCDERVKLKGFGGREGTGRSLDEAFPSEKIYPERKISSHVGIGLITSYVV